MNIADARALADELAAEFVDAPEGPVSRAVRALRDLADDLEWMLAEDDSVKHERDRETIRQAALEIRDLAVDQRDRYLRLLDGLSNTLSTVVDQRDDLQTRCDQLEVGIKRRNRRIEKLTDERGRYEQAIREALDCDLSTASGATRERYILRAALPAETEAASD